MTSYDLGLALIWGMDPRELSFYWRGETKDCFAQRPPRAQRKTFLGERCAGWARRESLAVVVCGRMAFGLTLALVVLLVSLRLLLPPVPHLLRNSLDRWGKRTTIMLCATSLAGAVLLIFISRH